MSVGERAHDATEDAVGVGLACRDYTVRRHLRCLQITRRVLRDRGHRSSVRRRPQLGLHPRGQRVIGAGSDRGHPRDRREAEDHRDVAATVAEKAAEQSIECAYGVIPVPGQTSKTGHC